MRVTIKDIARMAGVSAVTVSRAINNKPDIGNETKNRILNIAKELGYTPDSLAKSLVTRITNTIGILVPDTLDPFYPEVIQGIADECRQRGFSIILCHTQRSPDRELEYIRLLKGMRVEGMLLYPVQEDDRYIQVLKNMPIPYVLLNRHTDALECDYVMNDNVYGAYLAVSHLIHRGHRQITYICAKPGVSSGRERIKGARKAMKENGLPSTSFAIVPCLPTIDSCYTVVKKLLSNGEKPTALFIWDDLLAIGAIKVIFEAGLRIPQDIALVGYNDIEIAKHLFPALTTIHHACYEIGEKAARILIDRIVSGTNSEVRRIILQPELVIRETT